MATFTTPTEPRCAGCDGVLVDPRAICHRCATDAHYVAPVRSSPPLDLPPRRQWLVQPSPAGSA